ncbi:hypothetical protein DPEC_G00027980 [Dallia pectoralis]|uniref:Uncharacterized protein n=1 Tax=Dallia pectoralis TaxID=75939 RepID=A0ACC2HID6_DALPE|nr:hypothetical protein DPEC_G00027980 [Dallia pectoralis]
MIVPFLLLWCTDGVVAQIRYSVPEEADHGTFVGNIAEDLGLDMTKIASRRFQVVPGSRTPYLEVNMENGVLFVNEKIDREQICKQSASCLLHLEVFLENPLELFRVEIEVVDINDNPPGFPETDITVEISESAAPGTRFPLERAFDPDVGSNALRTYDITTNNYFYLDVQTQTDGNRFAELVLEKPLDREQQATHRYVLTAVDGGQPPRTGTALLVVRVLDSNDNVPAFDQPVYSVSLRENAPVGSLVIQLNATDLDEGPNGEIVYAFSNHVSSRVKDLFAIDARTGRVEVRGEVDFEESASYQIFVQAKDLGPNAVAAHCKVLVTVTDVNDNAPDISFSTVTESAKDAGGPELTSNATVKVIIVDQNDNPPAVIAPLGKNGTAREPLPRSAEPGYLVTRIVAMDADDGENARLSYSIQRGNENGMFRMDWRTGELRTARRVSTKRDPHQMYDLLIEVRDHGQPPLSSTASVFVVLVDGAAEEHRERGTVKSKETTLDLTLILIIALGSVSFVFLLAMIVLAVRCQKDKKLSIYTCLTSDCCLGCATCCGRQARARKKKLSKSDIMLVQSANVTGPGAAQVPVEESGSFGSHHQNQNYCYQVCLTPESAKTDLMFLKPCSPSRSTDTEHNPCGAIVTGYSDQQPDIISNGSLLSGETKHQRAELSYLVDRPRRVNSSAFQEADLVSSKDSGHGDSEQGDSDHDATNRGHSTGADLFSNCTEECKALGHSDRCWMPSFVPSDGRQAADYRSNLHVPGMDSVPDTEVFKSHEQTDDKSFSTFGKETPLSHQHHQPHLSHHHHANHHANHNANPTTLERKEFEALLCSSRAPYKPAYFTRKRVC